MTDNQDTYTAAGRVPVDTAEGLVVEPGGQVTGIDPDKSHNARLIQRGQLVRNAERAEPSHADLVRQGEERGLTGLKNKTKPEIAQAIEDHDAAGATAEGDE